MYHEISQKLFGPHGYDGRNWPMSFAERFTLLGILQHARPKLAVEIGTFQGGSLSLISHFSERVVSIEVNPEIARTLGPKHPNVRFVSESSRTALPRVLEEADRAGDEINFILIDGDHSEEGVREDIENALAYRPRGPLWILMHDSFNPFCRRGIKKVAWDAHPHVHWINVDLIPGLLNSVPDFEDQMWGGFALAYLEENQREGPLPRAEVLARQFAKTVPVSRHAEYFPELE